uniref:Obp56d_3 protein n=2 Tax=Fopius arisanus TaxID=64838 RepID=A0A0C9R1T1_9HYME
MNTSIVVLVLCALAAAAWGKEIPEEIRAGTAKCIEITGLDPDVFKSLHETGFENADDKVKCFGACLLKQIGVMAEDGSVDVETAKSLVPSDMPNHDRIVEFIETCHAEKGANECETAHAIGMCMHKNRVFED